MECTCFRLSFDGYAYIEVHVSHPNTCVCRLPRVRLREQARRDTGNAKITTVGKTTTIPRQENEWAKQRQDESQTSRGKTKNNTTPHNMPKDYHKRKGKTPATQHNKSITRHTTRHDTTRQDKARHDTTRQDKTTQHNTRQHNTTQDLTRQD